MQEVRRCNLPDGRRRGPGKIKHSRAVFTTRDGLRGWITETSTWIAAGWLGAAAIMSTTVFFLPLAMWFVFAAGLTFLGGQVAGWLVPACWYYSLAACPYCGHPNQVRLNIRGFRCSRCARWVRVRRGPGQQMLTLICSGKGDHVAG